jgi:transcription elongation factor Elf1
MVLLPPNPPPPFRRRMDKNQKIFVCPLCGSFTLVNLDLQPDYDIKEHCCQDRATRFLHGTVLTEDDNGDT